MGRSDFRGAVQPAHASLAAIFRREKPDVLQDCRCSARQTAAPCRATMEAFHDLRLDSRTFETRFASRFDSCAPAHFDLSVCPSMSHVSRGSIRSSLPSRLYLLSRKSLSSIVRLPYIVKNRLSYGQRPIRPRARVAQSLCHRHRASHHPRDARSRRVLCRSSHSLHCISAAPAALDRYLAALPAMSLIPFAPFFGNTVIRPTCRTRRQSSSLHKQNSSARNGRRDTANQGGISV